MEVIITLRLDNDGFVRRACPNCGEEFKWHSGPANQEAERHERPANYYCPMCGRPAGPDSWWTEQQLEYIQAMQQAAAMRMLNDGLDDVFKGMKSKYVTVKRTGRLSEPDEPVAPVEPDDMAAIASPCHAYEPVKVPEGARGRFYCLVCGAAFSA